MRSCCGDYSPNNKKDMSQYMRAGRPYFLGQGGNVAAERHAKTPKGQGRHTVHATRDQPPYELILTSIFSPSSQNIGNHYS